MGPYPLQGGTDTGVTPASLDGVGAIAGALPAKKLATLEWKSLVHEIDFQLV